MNRKYRSLIIAMFVIVLVSFTASVQATTALYSHSEVSGLNRICYYTSPAGTHAITVQAYQLCPMSIEV